MSKPAIIIFDGQCAMCSNSVQFMIRNDKRNCLKFAASESTIGKQIKAAFNLDTMAKGSMVFIKNGVAHTHSDAVLRSAGELGYPWKLAKVFLIIPKCLRDVMYGFVSRNRHRFASKKQVCKILADHFQERFEIKEAHWKSK
ncbi:DUF393 domain-containing protein [bacterium AH-315-I18]|nr:DUF393 domain-containing protein [bacterium AH-315-I18]